MDSLTVGKIEQDYLRRTLLREHDSSRIDVAAPAVITATARAALDHGYHVIIEGIMAASRYATALGRLIEQHHGPVHVFYLDISLAETLRRHRHKPDMDHVTEEHLRSWYLERDLLGVPGERMIGEASTLEQTVDTIRHDSGLMAAAPLAACPVRCAHCRANATATAAEGTVKKKTALSHFRW